MNREILFRGKNIYKQWLEGYYLRSDEGNHYIFALGDTVTYAAKNQVDSATVGQFTGLYDSNKKRIFEGDILEHYHANRYVVWGDYLVDDSDYLSRTTGFFTYNPKYKSIRCLNCFTIEQVIGNIHDNPELMEVKDAKAN